MKHYEAIPGLNQGPLPFSAAVESHGLVFVSGQASTGIHGEIVNDTLEGEMRRSFAHVESILRGAGLTLADVIQVRSYVDRPEDLGEYNRIYREIFSEPFPARTTLTGCLGGLLRFEVDVVAARKSTET